MKTIAGLCLCVAVMMTACGEKPQNDANTHPPTTSNGPTFAPSTLAPENTNVAEGSTITKTLNGTTVTSVDQGTGESDISLAVTLRKALASEKDLSVEAKNVTIVSREGNVILRGEVPTTAERDRVETITRQVVGPKAAVDDQIDVKTLH